MKNTGNSELTKRYLFYEGDLPSGYHFAFTVAVFNRPAYRLLQAQDGWLSFYILDAQTMTVHGHVHFHVCERVAVTPLRAPFASIEISPDVPEGVLTDFLEFVESRLLHARVLKITLKSPPEAYQPLAAELLHGLFLQRRYSVASSETTSIIFVSPTPFSDVIHPRKRRKLKQSAVPLIFSQLDKTSLRDVYEFISVCRIPKKYRLSITLNDLQRTADHFPEAYRLFGVRYGAQLVAASIAILVNDKVLYHFISDHIRKIGSHSPALVLMEGIYNFCVRSNLQILDLGTSAPGGVLNSRLLNFKEELGGKTAAKFTYTKMLG